MIRYQIVKPNKIKSGILDGYKRYTETHRVKYLEDGILKEKDVYFVDEWDAEKLKDIEDFMKNLQNITILAKDGKSVVGFIVLDTSIFDGYMNVPYIHTDNRFRKQNIGKNMMLLVSKIAKDKGARKLYISGHPEIGTQSFYEKMGCVLATKINKELYDLEPLDIQLERSLDYVDIMMRKINLEFQLHQNMSSTLLNKVAIKVYQVMPEKDPDFLDTVKPLLIDNRRYHFSLGTLLLKKKQSVIDEKYLDYYEDVLYNHINGWGQVDQYCYRVLGPIMNRNYDLFYKLQLWSKSENKDVRRASLVAMLTSSGNITCTYPLEKVMLLVEALKNDLDFHVRKAVGWVLKCTYLEYPKEVVAYLIENRYSLDRMIFRYALEHMDNELKYKLMQK